MKYFLAENSGFCFGVNNAMKKTLDVLNSKNINIYSLGPLIHNDQVINLLNKKGLKVIKSIDQINDGKIIIRSHGVPLNIYEEAKNKGIEIIDCTCPFVKKIQNKVYEFYNKGYTIIIIGDPNHPEVKGINGWCNDSAIIINSKDNVEDVPKCDKICIVAQTTITEEKFNLLSNEISQRGKKVEVFNTICNATKLRQNACKELAKNVDAMIVIGGYHSSNTRKLKLISEQYCKNTYHIETASELDLKKLKNFERIGITAGASTPEWIIKEVINKMDNYENDFNNMLEAIEASMVKLHRGDIVKGKVISVNDDEVMVNVGYKSDGLITKDELTVDHTISPNEIVKEGDEIEVYVLKLDDGDGNVLLSRKRIVNMKSWDELEVSYNNNELVEAKVIEIVKGGVIVTVKGVKGFIPASHLSSRYVEDLSKYLGKTMDVKIIEFDKRKKRIVLSRKIVEKELEEKLKNKTWNSLKVGNTIEGEVKRITNFGAFVDIGGVDGLIHISELSWGRVNHPSEVVKIGDKVQVCVLDFDKEKERVSLGLKQTKPHPWENISARYKVNDIVEGKVIKLLDFGAFVNLEEGVDGLVHVSQISNSRVNKPSDKLKIGQIVKVKIIDINEKDQKISLSIKEATNTSNSKDLNKYNNNDNITIGEIVNKK